MNKNKRTNKKSFNEQRNPWGLLEKSDFLTHHQVTQVLS